MFTLGSMNDWTTLSRDELLTVVLRQHGELQTTQAELDTKSHQLREQDIRQQEQMQQLDKLSQEYEELQLAYNKLLEQRFRNRSERYLDDPDQLRLDLSDTDEAADAALGLSEAVEELEQTIPEHTRRKPRKKRDEKLPEHLPRYEVIAEGADELKHCPTHGQRTLLPEAMWDRTETLEFERPKLKVCVTLYPKYACDGQPQCGIYSPERPTGIVEGNKYDSSRPPASMLAVPAPKSSPASTVIICRCIACKTTSRAAVGRRRGARNVTSFRNATS